MRKRFLAILLVCMMVVGMLPTTALAAGTAENNSVKVELVKDSTTFSGKEVLRVDFYAISGTDKPDNHMVYLKYDASKLYPVLVNGNDGTSQATDFSVSKSAYFAKNNYSHNDGIIDNPSEVMFYTIIKDGSGYICWKVTEPSGTPAFADYTHISSTFFGLKEGTSFDALPSDIIGYSDPKEDDSITAASVAAEITVNGGGEGNVFIYKKDDGSADTMTVTPTINAGEGVTIVKPEYSGSVSAPTVTKNKGGAVELTAISISGETVEYGYSETNSAASVTNWQTSTTFNGLTVDKTLYFFARVTETAEHQSKASDGTSVTIADKEMPTCTAPSGVTATYGQTLSEITLTNPGGNTDGTWSWVDGTQSVGDVGEKNFKAKFTPTDTATYQTVSNIDVTVKVNPKSITPTIADISDQEYTGSAITPTVTVTGDGKTLVKDTDYTVEYSNNTNKGTATVTVKAKSGSNYTFSDVTKNFTIVGKAGKITFADGSYNIPYDGAAVTAGNSGTDLIYTYVGDGSVTVKWYADNGGSKGSELSGAPKDAGIYWIGVSATAGTNYGAVAEVTHSFTITPKSINGAAITLGTQATYNGTAQNVVITSVKVGEVTLSSGTDYDITAGGSATNVGNTTLTIKGKGNYDGTKTATWSLQKATPTTSDFTISTDLTKDYTGSPITVPAPTSSKNGIGARTVKYADSTTAPTNAGSYTVTFDVAEGQNYKEATGLSIGTLTINKVAYTGTKTASATVRSGQVNTDVTLTLPTLPAGASYAVSGTVGGTGSALISAHSISGTTLTYSTTSQTDGTSATITIGVTGATNYNNYDVVVTITAKDKNPAEVTLGTVPTSKTYGDANFTVTASAAHTEAGGTWTWTSSNESVLKVTGTSTTGTVQVVGQGSATITAKYESANYLGEAASASISVNKKNVTITGLSAQNKVYDGNTTATVNGTAVVSGKVGSDDVTVTAGSAAFADENVGSGKTVTFTGYTLSGAKAGNYNLTAQPASVTANITAKPVTVTVTATDRDYVSGNRNVVLVAGSVTGAIGGDTVNVDVSGATGTMENEDAGTGKAVTVTGVALSGTDAGNYNLTAQPTGVTVTINKKNYDGSITGNKNVHTNQAQTGVTFDMSEKFGVIKGAAVKSVSEGTDSDNLIDNVSFDGNIVKFDVASIADAGKTATINVVISCTNFNDITAVLTVKTVDKDEAGVTISGVPAEAKTYGDADLTLTASAATPGANGTWTWETSDSSVLQLTPNGNKVTVKLLKAGKATVTAKYESDTTIGQLTTANIRVEKATITVAAKNQSIYVNGTVPDLTSPVKDTHYTVTGLASGDTLGGVLTMKYQKDGVDATPDATKTGTYDIVISGATAPTDGNYNDVVFTAGTLTISNRPSSGGGVSTYSITAEPTEHGTISVSPKNASKGTTVTVTVKPDEGYELDALTVTNGSGKAVTVTEKDGKYTFTMPASKVSVKATFKEAEKPVTMPFADVAEGAWYYDSIKYVYSNGMMVGTGDTKFSPNATTTRGMIVTILYRLEGEPVVSGASSFNDVAEGRYYANAVKWAAENEIVSGYGNGQFGPEDPITREQMAAILYRYATFKDFDMTKTADLSKFTDSGKISDWSKAALSWANAEGLVNGKGGGILDPLGNATRAEVSAILYCFCENVVK